MASKPTSSFASPTSVSIASSTPITTKLPAAPHAQNLKPLLKPRPQPLLPLQPPLLRSARPPPRARFPSNQSADPNKSNPRSQPPFPPLPRASPLTHPMDPPSFPRATPSLARPNASP